MYNLANYYHTEKKGFNQVILSFICNILIFSSGSCDIWSIYKKEKQKEGWINN